MRAPYAALGTRPDGIGSLYQAGRYDDGGRRVGGQGGDAGDVPAEQEQDSSGDADLQGQRGVGEALLEEFPVGVLVEVLGVGLGTVRASR
ncbi:hypothetical protein [Kitasatospora herbaricolor]|uniref:Uncharacterized protein n=1 Tax=Kitasatospora herbaricolor TaxID=68217 RepID=A0ABZ1WJJ9_9ACTN|nr:hypothetical protein [Kitasatospora herbaricolor]